jgi:hypothetical protein
MTVWRSEARPVDEPVAKRHLGVLEGSPHAVSPARCRSRRGFSTVFPSIHTSYYYYEVLK